MLFDGTHDKKKYKLNNCPFCGSPLIEMRKWHEAIQFAKRFEKHFRTLERAFEKYGQPHRVHCEGCGADGPPCFSPENAANFWNKSTPKPDPLEEAMKKK